MTGRPCPIDLATLLPLISARLTEAVAITEAALARAQAGDHTEAFARALDCEEPAREAIVLINAISVVEKGKR
jgi:hypothetical protein